VCARRTSGHQSDCSAVADLISRILRHADNSAQEVIEMTALTQSRRDVAYRLAPSLTVALVITLGLGLALALATGVLAWPELTNPLYPYAPGEPDLQRSFA
jgi:hypothetical protein